MTPRDQRLLFVATALASVLMLAAGLGGHADLVAYAVPMLLVALPLVAGHYPGEERIARVAARVRPPRRRPRTIAAPRVWLWGGPLVPRGGRLIACALAVRPPPVPASR